MLPMPTMPSVLPWTSLPKCGASTLRFPVAGLGVGVQFGDAAGTAHDQREAQVGGAFGQHVGGVGQHDAAFVEVTDVVVVVADRDAGHHFQLFRAFQLLAAQLATQRRSGRGLWGRASLNCAFISPIFGLGMITLKSCCRRSAISGDDAAEGKDSLFHRKLLSGGSDGNAKHANILVV